MSRIEERFALLRSQRKKGFIAYIGAGDPDLEATRELALSFERAGVDILELGVPFSDPLADGVVNQLAAQRGLAAGATPKKVLETVALIRKQSQIPIVLYIYYNLLHRCGVENFIAEAAKCGVDGLLALDLPPEESGDYERLMREAGLSVIYLIAPTTPDSRVQTIVRRATGFIYYVSREGVTGMQSKIAANISEMTATIRAHTDLPIAVGFGISTPEQAAMVAEHAEAIVVGSAIVNQVAEYGQKPGFVSKVSEFVQSLSDAVKGVKEKE